MLYNDILQCRLCKSPALDTILDWGMVPLTGVFPAPGQAVEQAPIHLVRCWQCGLVQLRHSVDPKHLYGPTYGYRSGQNPMMVQHLAQVAQDAGDILKRFTGTAIDIGGNDGTLLKLLGLQWRKVNVDPLAYLTPEAEDVYTLQELFNVDRVKNVVLGEHRADLIFSLAMFYDLDDPLAFAQQVRELLADDGLWVLEVADADAMLDGTIYDGICHEHVTYWDRETLQQLVGAAGFRVVKEERNKINGGSLLFFCRKAEPVDPTFKTLRDGTEWMRFDTRVAQHQRWFHWNFYPHLHGQRKLYGLGASTKGNVLLTQLCQVWREHNPSRWPFTAIGEINPDKVGKETPVGRIPIVTQDEALREADDLVVFPWHFRKFFEETIRPRLRPGQRLIYPLPF